MLPKHEHIKKLWQLYVTDQASQEQVKELFGYLKDAAKDNEHDLLARQALTDITSSVSPQSSLEDIDQAWQSILTTSDSLKNALKLPRQTIAGQYIPSPPRRNNLFKTAWFRYAAAIIILLATAIYLLSIQKKESLKTITAKAQDSGTDIAPSGNKAILTLADGSTIILDSADNGTLAQQGNAQVVKLTNGQIVYNLTSTSPYKQGKTAEIFLNTMRTPRGGQYQLTLPDGTKVWLNAESSITYPTAFADNKRKVKVTGEAYFEVKKNKSLPFWVDVDGKFIIEVLGTHFNVNSYTNQRAISTTLLEGSVRIAAFHQLQMLKPGQQAVVAIAPEQPATGQIKIVTDANIEKVMAWKNGIFDFDGANLEEVMQQITRWYDIEVVYERGVPDIYFGGKVSRNVSLSGLLKGLEGARVHFRIEGRKLIVLP